jgi:hypothetical protein
MHPGGIGVAVLAVFSLAVLHASYRDRVRRGVPLVGVWRWWHQVVTADLWRRHR